MFKIMNWHVKLYAVLLYGLSLNNILFSHQCSFVEHTERSVRDMAIDYDDDFPIIISLGFCCAVASILETHNLRKYAFPFDWIWSPFNGLCDLLEHDFIDFLNPSYLIPQGRGLFNMRYSITFHHDFPVFVNDSHEVLCANYMDYYEEVLEKYTRRIKRFNEVMHSNKRVILIRGRYTVLEQEQRSYDEIKRLRDILLEKYPSGNWTLVVLDNHQDFNKDWGLERVKTFYLTNHTDPWGGGGGDSASWVSILGSLGLL